MDANQILPLVGLGLLRFGATRNEVGAFDALYGSPQAVVDEAAAADPVLDVMAQYVDQVPEMRELMAAMKAEQSAVVVEHRGPTSPILRFRDGKLVEIVLSAKCGEAHLDAIRPFLDTRRAVVAALTTRNGGRQELSGVYLFDRLGIIAHGFIAESEERILNLLDPAGARDQRRAFANG